MEHASENLLSVVKYIPNFNIGNFFLKISIINPANNFAINDKNITEPSRRPKDFELPPNSSTINIGNSEKIIDEAIPQQKCIQHKQFTIWLLFSFSETEKKFLIFKRISGF